jgi:hypothetical protein
VLKAAKGANQEKKPEETHKEVNYIYGGPESYESRRKQKLTAREVMAVSPATAEYLKWFEVPITIDRSSPPDFVPKPRCYPLIVSPIVKDVNISRVLVGGGSSLNILFLKTFDQMGLSRSLLHLSWVPFYGIVPSAVVTSVGQITLPITFRTRKNFHLKTTIFGHQFQDSVQCFLGTVHTLQVHGNPTLCLLGLKDSRAMWHHLHQGRCQTSF